jgi:methyl-accepting chemotaxis protein
VTDIMSEVSSASNEQSTGIAQVNEALNRMDEVTQQNAALVEQAAAAAQSMAHQAQALMDAVSVFKVDDSRQTLRDALVQA